MIFERAIAIFQNSKRDFTATDGLKSHFCESTSLYTSPLSQFPWRQICPHSTQLHVTINLKYH